jgi:hypothetical protein
MAAELVLIGFVSKASEEAIPMTASKAILLNIMVKYLIRIFCKENERSEYNDHGRAMGRRPELHGHKTTSMSTN